MSDQDEALLDEDLGDEEYDLGNDEEEALLADDYEIDRQNSYKGEEETDDVLDLGVTDALDDLEGDDENVEYRSDIDNHSHSDFYKEEHATVDNTVDYYEETEHEDVRHEQHYEEDQTNENIHPQNLLSPGDLREKLQKNVQRKVFVGNGQGLEDDDCDQAEERRNRFQNERIMIPPKMNNEIPDSLENVVTMEQVRMQSNFRGRGRGRGIWSTRGGRFLAPIQQPNFNQRFNPVMRGQPTFPEQQKPFRPPLLEDRPPIYARPPTNNHPMSQPQQQIIYQQNNPQPPQYLQNGPPQPNVPHYADTRTSFNQPQYPIISQGPRMNHVGPRPDYRPRGGPQMSGMPQRFSCPPAVPPQYLQNPPQHFQVPMVPGNHGPSLLGTPGLPHQVPNQVQVPPGIHGNPGGPMTINQGPPMQENPGSVMMQNFPRMPPQNQRQPLPNQQAFDSRPVFQEPTYEGRPTIYDARPNMYNQPPQPLNHINSSVPVAPLQSGPPHIPNVPLPPGHKILINPHFRGAVQPNSDARLAWDPQQQQQQQQQHQPLPPQHQPPPQHQLHQHPASISNETFQPALAYQNQDPYGQPVRPLQPQQQQQQPHLQQPQTYQTPKSDDPYSYFSDVWQENKTQKSSPGKSYPVDNNYSRDSYSSYASKYQKSESSWDPRDSYQEDQRGSSQSSVSYRDRDPPSRPRAENVARERVSASSNSYHNEPYEQKSSSRTLPASARLTPRGTVKRSPEIHERSQRASSPKRVKPLSSRLEFRSVANDNSSVKKEEDADPEMREYRKKMEEQKRLREKILQEKENRRKQAAMEKTVDETKGDSRNAENAHQEMISVSAGQPKESANLAPIRSRVRPVNVSQNTEGAPVGRIVRSIPTIEGSGVPQASKTVEKTIQPGTRRIVIHKSLPTTQKIATSVQKTVSNLQRPQATTRLIQPQKTLVKKLAAGTTSQKPTNQNRTTVQDSPTPLRVNTKNVAKSNIQKVVMSPQKNQRLVLQKTAMQMKQRQSEATKLHTVRIENLAASTSETQLRRMCQGIGTLESIHMGDGNATIVFKTQSAAQVFHKKYQRKMLDLSLINVRLVQSTVSDD